MTRTFFRWTFGIASLLAIGPLASLPLAGLHDVDGGHAVTILLNNNLLMGLAFGALLFLVAAIVAAIGTQYFTLGSGTACAGMVVAWGAWRLATIEMILRRADTKSGHPENDLLRLAVEGFVVTLIAAALLAMITAINHRHQRHTTPSGSRWTPLGTNQDRESIIPAAAGAIAVGAIVAGILAWLVSFSTLKGQTVMAAVIAGIGAGAAAHLIGTSMRSQLTPVVPAISLALVSLLGPLAAKFGLGATPGNSGSSFFALLIQNQFYGISKPLSLDWAAGALLGAPLGMSWAGAMMDHRALELAPAPASDQKLTS